ncbi:C10 family peptidase [Hoylesella timonensis]|uniref:Peptidase n=1 Tax=Hoylesella timonensis TaxID=386414 RepID=A0A2N6Q7M4_9BACT|nr:C10 family peptidase [Hoylesella timonensis]PMC10998.1 peptidase [Hoylesella timonensis]
MRKIFTPLALLCATTVAFSAPVGRQQARQAALAFIKSHASTNSQIATRASQALPSLNEVASTNAYYIFNVGKGQGFVIASADDRTVDVLGYAEEGSYDEQQCPASLKMLLAQYRQEVSMLNDMPATTKPATTRANRTLQPIAPLLKTTWSQYGPYNLQTPMHKDKHCVTGCVATAATQIMGYFQYPKKAPALPAYKAPSAHLQVPELAESTFEWNDILPSYRIPTTQQQQDAVAKLMRYVGQAVSMDYTADDSGADSYNVILFLTRLFGYSKDMHRVFRDRYTSEEWYNLIYNELKAKRPVYYFAEDVVYNYGHAFVCDGYKEGDFFHINWGWGGQFNGYYRLSVLSPREYGFKQLPSIFTREQGAIIGFRPSVGADVFPKVVDVKEMTPLQDQSRSNSGEDFTDFDVTMKCVNNYGEAFDADCGIGFWQGGRLINTVKLFSATFKTNGKIQRNEANFSIPHTLAKGKYTVLPVYRIQGESEWKACGGIGEMAQEIEITDTELKTSTAKPVLEVKKVDVKGSKEAGRPLFVTLTIENKGDELYDTFDMFFTYDYVASTTTFLPARQTTDVMFELYPKVAGEFDYSFECKSGATISSKGNITITEPKSKNIPSVEVKIEQSEENAFKAPAMKGKLIVTNSENADYCGGFDIELRCKKGDTDAAYLENKLSLADIIPANSKKEIPFSIDNVVAGAQYAIYAYGYKVEKQEDFIHGGMEYIPKRERILKTPFYMAKDASTAIAAPHVSHEPMLIYNLQGVVVGKGEQQLKSLPKGIYIIGGKKVVK